MTFESIQILFPNWDFSRKFNSAIPHNEVVAEHRLSGENVRVAWMHNREDSALDRLADLLVEREKTAIQPIRDEIENKG